MTGWIATGVLVLVVAALCVVIARAVYRATELGLNDTDMPTSDERSYGATDKRGDLS